MNNNFSFPFYIKFAFIAIGAFAFVATLYLGQHVILPLVYATIIAILLNPFVNLLVRLKFNRTVAIALAVIVAIGITAALIYFISMQVNMFTESYPKLKLKFNEASVQAICWTSDHFNIKESDINDWITDTQNNAIENMGGAIGQTLSTINSILIIVLLLPVYLCMILYYKNLLLEFIRKLFKADDHVAVFEVLVKSKTIIQSYLLGLLIEAAIVATLNSIGLLALGIDFAIILGVTGAIINIIPYIGGVIAIALPMIIAYVTKDSTTYPLLVLGLYLTIQFIDNHFIIPSIVASKVKINALVSIIVVLSGGMLWGIPGMFLSIPLTAIAKVVFDHIEPLKPWGYLLGNMVTTVKPKLRFIYK